MPAKPSYEVTKGLFFEMYGRYPRPTEMLKQKVAQGSMLAVCAMARTGAEDYCRLWQRVVGDPIEEANIDAAGWDEFALMGCLESGGDR